MNTTGITLGFHQRGFPSPSVVSVVAANTKSRQQLRAQVVSGSNASEGLLAKFFHEVCHNGTYRFHFSRIHVRISASKRGQLATVAVLPAPSPFFSQIVNLALHFLASLKFVLSRKQTNSSEVFQNAGNDFHGRNR